MENLELSPDDLPVRDTRDLDTSGGVTDDPGVEEVGGHPDDEGEPALDSSPF